MTLKDCYNSLEGDYEDVMGRLMTEKLVQKFVLKFLSDMSCTNLIKDMEEGKYEEAFREAHTLKGVCQNLSFTKLYKSSAEVTELLRGGETSKAAEVMPQVIADYEQTVAAIGQLDQ